MKPTGFTFLFLVSGALVISLPKDTTSIANFESSPSTSQGKTTTAAATGNANNSTDSNDGSSLEDLLDTLGLTNNETLPSALSYRLDEDAMRSLQKTLNSASPDNAKSMMRDSSPLDSFLDNVPLVGSIFKTLRSVLNLVDDLLDHVINLVVNLLHFVAKLLPILLE